MRSNAKTRQEESIVSYNFDEKELILNLSSIQNKENNKLPEQHRRYLESMFKNNLKKVFCGETK